MLPVILKLIYVVVLCCQASIEENMQYLLQRSCEADSHTEKKQLTTICIIYWAFLHDDMYVCNISEQYISVCCIYRIVPPLSLLSALSGYICAHPNTHLLPAITLQQVIFLFAVSVKCAHSWIKLIIIYRCKPLVCIKCIRLAAYFTCSVVMN